MNIQWFRVGFGLLMISFFPRMPGKIVILFILFGYFLHRKLFRSFAVLAVCAAIYLMEFRIWIPEEPANTEGTVTVVKDSYITVRLKDQNILVYGAYGVNYDDKVRVSCSLSELTGTHNRAGFSYAEYALGERTRYSCHNASVNVLNESHSFRSRVYLKIRQEDDEIQTFLRRFLFSENSSESELSGMLLSGGIHVSFLLHMIGVLLGFLYEEKQKKTAVTLITVFLTLFFRFKMFMIRLIVSDLLRYTDMDKADRFGCLCTVMVLLFPYSVSSSGFLFPMLMRLCTVFKTRNSLGSMIFIPSLIHLYLDGYVRLFNTVLLLILRPLYSFCFMISFISIWIPLRNTVRILSRITQKVESFSLLDRFTISGKPHWIVLILLVFLWIEWNSYRSRKTGISLFLTITMVLFQNNLLPLPSVTFIDVGQGDSALVQLSYGKGNFLIDTGGIYGRDVASEILYPVLSSYGIRNLDAVFLSHEDFDHSGGCDSLKDLIQINRVVRDKAEEYKVGDLVMKDYLWDRHYEDPNADCITQYFELCGTRFFFAGDIPKEVEYELTENINQLETDILKLGHHGSATSSSEEFLECLRPSSAIISSGKNNWYHHPSYTVTERLKNYRIPYYNTAYTGAITFTLFPGGWIMRTESGILNIRFSVQKLLRYFLPDSSENIDKTQEKLIKLSIGNL